jgi:transposase-like protein
MKKETNPLNQVKPATSKVGRKQRTPSPSYSAQEKAQAVLAVWTERARPAQICQQLSINPISFHQWQERAMEGMLQALESRVNLAGGEALSPRLQRLLAKRQQAKAASSRLCTRLENIQRGAPLQSDKAQQT